MARRFILATDDKGRSRYVAIDVVDIAVPAVEGGWLLKAADGRILGAARGEDFDPREYED